MMTITTTCNSAKQEEHVEDQQCNGTYDDDYYNLQQRM